MNINIFASHLIDLIKTLKEKNNDDNARAAQNRFSQLKCKLIVSLSLVYTNSHWINYMEANIIIESYQYAHVYRRAYNVYLHCIALH